MTCLSRSNQESDFFADDTALYLAISSTTESKFLQTDLASLNNGKRCEICNLTPINVRSFKLQKGKNPNTKYILHYVELEIVPTAKYLGAIIVDDLSWSKHINITTKKANLTLGFLKSNIRVHNKDLKSVAYN